MGGKFSINSIALGNIRERRRQYVLLIAGIVLAIYFAAAVLLFASTMLTSLQEQHYRRLGEQDAIVFNCKEAPLEDLVTKGILAGYGTAEILGYVLPDGESMSGGFSLAVFDETALALARKDTLEGRLPERKGEVALEQSALARLRTGAGVGDTLTLTILVPDGTGFLDAPAQKSYTLVGVLADQLIHLDRWPFTSPAYSDYPAGVLSADEQIAAGGQAVVNLYGRYARDARSSFDALREFSREHGLMVAHEWAAVDNTRYHFFDRDHSPGDGDIIATSVFFMVIAVVLVLAACLGIVNAFSSSLETRRRQIGLLRAVGATKKQIREIFGRETLLLALFSIPLGLSLACLTVWGITHAMGVNYIFRPNALVLAAVAVAGVLCVMLAASIPLRKAAKIPPMQAIRDVELTRRVRKSRVASKPVFDVPRLIARRNLTLYKNRQVSITAMLAVSIVLMSLVSFAAAPLIMGSTYDYGMDYQLLGSSYRVMDWLMEFDVHRPGITEQDRADAAALPTVKSVTGQKLLRVKILADEITPYMTSSGFHRFSYLSPEPRGGGASDVPEGHYGWLELEHSSYLASKEKYGYTRDYLTVDLCGFDGEVMEKLAPYVSAGRIDIDRLSSGEEIVMAAPAEYGLYEVHSGSDSWFRTDYTLDREKDYHAVYQNDMFQVGDVLTLSLLYTEGDSQHPDGYRMYNKDGSRILPEDVVRVDREVTIGAIMEPYDIREGMFNQFVFFHPEVGDILTTTAGLKALGFDLPYASLAVTLSESPDAAMEEYLDTHLSQIAARTAGAELRSFVAMARENREMVYGLLIAAGAVVTLFFVICAGMINNALSARIRAGRREIGTIRAVGASGRDISRTYMWQLFSMFTWGTAIGMGAQLALCRWFITSEHVAAGPSLSLPVWQPLLFVAVLFGICSLNLRSQVAAIFRGSIVENIREL